LKKGETSPVHNQNLKRNKSSPIPTASTLSPPKAQLQFIASTKKRSDSVEKASHFDDTLVIDDQSQMDSRKVEAI
jgi:hypothetical protein